MSASNYAIDGDEAIPALASPIVWPLNGDEPGLFFGWKEMPAELRAAKRCISFLPAKGKESRPIKIVLLRSCEPIYVRSLDPRMRIEFAFEGRQETGQVSNGCLAYVLPSKPLVLRSAAEDLAEALEHAQRSPEPRRVTLIANPWLERVDLGRLHFDFSSLEVVDQSPRQLAGPERVLRFTAPALSDGMQTFALANRAAARVAIEDSEAKPLGTVEPGETVLVDLGGETQAAALIRS